MFFSSSPSLGCSALLSLCCSERQGQLFLLLMLMLSLGSLGEQAGLGMNSGVSTKQLRSAVPIAQLCATKCSLRVDARLLVEKLQNPQSQTGGQCSGKLQSSTSPVSPSSITNLHQILFVITDKVALNLKSHCFCPTPSSNDLESLSLI